MITSIEDVLDYVPFYVVTATGEAHCPCPYCKDGKTTSHNGRTFYGDDRLIIFSDFKGVHCRKCKTSKRIEQFVLDISGMDVDLESLQKSVATPTVKISEPLEQEDSHVALLHKAVQRDWWKRFGWTDALIDHFRLGYGQMYRRTLNKQRDRHVIPFKPSSFAKDYEGWVFEGRLNRREDEKIYQEPYNKKTAGLTNKQYFWWINEDQSSDTVAITEGLKDAITAYALGYRRILAIFGASAWSRDHATFLMRWEVKTAHLFGDHDEAGQAFNKEVATDLHAAGIRPLGLNWRYVGAEKSGYDLTDLLATRGDLAAKQYLADNMHGIGAARRGRIKDYRTVDPNYTLPDPAETKPLAVIAEEMPGVIADFIDTYSKRVKANKGQGVVLTVAAPTGVGKSYTLVQEAQHYARKAQAKRDEKRAAKEVQIAQLRLIEGEEAAAELAKAERSLANMNQASVLFASPFINGWEDVQLQPGFDPDLWFNLEARNPDNCGHHGIANTIASRGYNVSQYCKLQCPLAAHCREKGYLSQEKARKAKPITFVRHATLSHNDSLLEGYELIIIDENFTGEFTGYTVVHTPDDLTPVRLNWETYLDEDAREQAESLNQLITALRKTMIGSQDKTDEGAMSGMVFMQALQSNLDEPLDDVLSRINDDLVERFQPGNAPPVDNYEDLPRRVLGKVVDAVRHELPDFQRGVFYNSRLHCYDGQIKVNDLAVMKVPKSKPIIVADGTAMPELYGLLFDRQVITYAPDTFNPQARVVQMVGTDMSRATIQRQVGTSTWNKLKKGLTLPELPGTVTDVLGEPFEISEIGHGLDFFGSDAINKMVDTLLGVVERHQKMLFVSYKSVSMLVRDRLLAIADENPRYADLKTRMAFDWYGNLRGTNRYKDYDSVFLAGVPRQPYSDIHRRAQAWARLAGLREYIPAVMTLRSAPYHSATLCEGATYIGFENDFAQALADNLETSEIIQCLDRIRLRRGGEKSAYLYMSRPAAKWVTHIYSSSVLARTARDDKEGAIIEWIDAEYKRTHKLPAQRAIQQQFSLSLRQARNHQEKYLTLTQ